MNAMSKDVPVPVDPDVRPPGARDAGGAVRLTMDFDDSGDELAAEDGAAPAPDGAFGSAPDGAAGSAPDGAAVSAPDGAFGSARDGAGDGGPARTGFDGAARKGSAGARRGADGAGAARGGQAGSVPAPAGAAAQGFGEAGTSGAGSFASRAPAGPDARDDTGFGGGAPAYGGGATAYGSGAAAHGSGAPAYDSGADSPPADGQWETGRAGAGGASRSRRADSAGPEVRGNGPLPIRLAGIEVTLSVELGRRQLSLRDLMTSAPGQLFALDTLTSEPVEVLVNGRLFARGEVVAMGDQFGVRLTELVEPEA